ncbi:MAG TPA: polysaccharide deacetylase family protein, partial [bacterium]|nr:polysaccharide deacetylase family protein [bacterium]
RRTARAVEQVADLVLRHSGLLGMLRGRDLREHARPLRVLCYHRVSDPAHDPIGGHPGVISATPQAFAEQIGLVARHYFPIGTEELRASLVEGRALPVGATLVTFDDGYRDFLTHAWPVLKAHRVPAIVFVPTAYPDRAKLFWWDELWQMLSNPVNAVVTLDGAGRVDLRTPRGRWAALKVLRNELWTRRPAVIEQRMADLRATLGVSVALRSSVLSWGELRALAADGVIIASHGRTHASMPSLSDEDLLKEIEGAQADLERELGVVEKVFAYPFGHYDARAAGLLKERGFMAAFGVSFGRWTPAALDRFALPRQMVNVTHSRSRFQLGLSGIHPRHILRRSATASSESLQES